MTRLAVLADLHGNLPALEAVIADMAQFSPDHVVVAGDSINLVPFSREVVDCIVSRGWAAIRGNHEFYLLDYGTPRCPPAWRNLELLPCLVEQMEGRWRTIIAAWPDALCLRFPDAPSVRVVHALSENWPVTSPDTPETDILPLLAGIDEDTVIYGHSHLVDDRQIGRWHILNPGGTGFPLDGNRDASYLILDGDESGWRAAVRRVSYDPVPIFTEFERQKFATQNGAFGFLITEELKTARPHVIPFFRWLAEHYPGEPRTIERGQEFVRNLKMLGYTKPTRRIDTEERS